MSEDTSVIDLAGRLEAESARRRMDELFRALIENALDLIVILDAEGILSTQALR